VNEHLQTRNYLAGQAITVADFAVFTAANPVVSSFTQQQIDQHVNLVRW
jgi:glutathione S-transferase